MSERQKNDFLDTFYIKFVFTFRTSTSFATTSIEAITKEKERYVFFYHFMSLCLFSKFDILKVLNLLSRFALFVLRPLNFFNILNSI